MLIVVGLGNPDKQYQNNYHNIGYMAVQDLASKMSVNISKKSCQAVIGEKFVSGEPVVLALPTTYMNNSGDSVKELIGRYKATNKDIVVVYDDIDLPVGQIRIRKEGSAGTHNGMKSIIQHLGTQEFTRVRIGIGPKPAGLDLAYFVLSPFSKADRKVIDETMKEIVPIAELITEGKTERAMDKYNQKK